VKICFFGNISGALKGDNPGGGELQVALLAKALVRAGHKASVVDPFVSEGFSTPDGIRVVSVPEWRRGVRVIRMFSQRIPGLYRALKAERADVYYVRIRGEYNIVPYLAARDVKATFVYAVASDLDVLGFKDRVVHHYLKSMRPYDLLAYGVPTEIVLPFVLRKADIILAQHEFQLEALRKKNLNAFMFRNIIEMESTPSSNDSPGKKEGYVYVGSLDVRKGFSELYDLVKNVPNQNFGIIGGPRGKRARQLIGQMRELRNATIFGRLSRQQTLQHIASAKALVCTSPVEGFPNVFLEAWAVGTPVISLNVDPGGVIERHNLGYACGGDFNRFLEIVKAGVGSFDGDALIRYVRQYHSFDDAAAKFERIVTFGKDGGD
jgi:glycosyltransferase involved in cell wall biosynthesis